MAPARIQLSRRRGFRLQEASLALNGLPAVNVARPSVWGNPYSVEVFGRERAVKLFDNTVRGHWSPGLFDSEADDTLMDRAYRLHCAFRKRLGAYDAVQWARAGLGGRNLACWCKPGEPCHADVLLKLANEAP
jgi:hypothetical protein